MAGERTATVVKRSARDRGCSVVWSSMSSARRLSGLIGPGAEERIDVALAVRLGGGMASTAGGPG